MADSTKSKFSWVDINFPWIARPRFCSSCQHSVLHVNGSVVHVSAACLLFSQVWVVHVKWSLTRASRKIELVFVPENPDVISHLSPWHRQNCGIDVSADLQFVSLTFRFCFSRVFGERNRSRERKNDIREALALKIQLHLTPNLLLWLWRNHEPFDLILVFCLGPQWLWIK